MAGLTTGPDRDGRDVAAGRSGTVAMWAAVGIIDGCTVSFDRGLGRCAGGQLTRSNSGFWPV